MNSCIFCKIANGEIPSYTIYEDKDVRVILDINPATKGHCLILPKMHVENIYELPDELISRIMVVAKEISNKLKGVFACDGLNIVQNNGEIAGQTVFHYHLHIIPRYVNDNQKITWKPQEYTEEKLREIKQAIIESDGY